MTAYLICEDGPHAGQVITLQDETEWVFGRDPDVSFQVLEDPMVSRKHAVIREEEGLYFLENLSTVNPTEINDEPIDGTYQLSEDDIIMIGNNFFRFTEHMPSESQQPEATSEPNEPNEENPISSLPSLSEVNERWMLKVISGPNQGAEFGMAAGSTYVLGKDAESCDVIFQDMSVSRKHASISVDQDGLVTIEDLGSRNGVFINGQKIEEPKEVHSQDLISFGTTSFLIIDRERSRETIYSPHYTSDSLSREPDEENVLDGEALTDEEVLEKDWKDTFIPTRHLVIASICCLFIFAGFVSMLALFRGQTIVASAHDETEEIRHVIKHFEEVRFSYNTSTGRIFLVGHVLTDVDHSKLSYLIRNIPYIKSIEDNIVVDESVWDSMNALLSKNTNWHSIMVTSTKPGNFVARGFLETEKESEELTDFFNLYFPYLNLLDNQVVVENTLHTQITNLLIEKGFVNVSFQFTAGELVMSGRVNSKEEREFEDILDEIEKIQGVRQLKNFVIYTDQSTARIDLSSKYQVTGTSKLGSISQYVLINGKILSKGDTLDGMVLTEIMPHQIRLDKDGIKYKIDYNQQ